ncbi:MAG: exodeoxyribonuclease III [Syntrophaceae bacterium]
MKTFTLATYNVNSVRSRLHVIIPWISKNRPDVLCMQETKVEDSKFPRAEFENAGYHVSFSGGKKDNGVAIASLAEPAEPACGFDNDPPDRDRLIRAKFSGITIINAYVPQGFKMDNPKFEYKLKWFARFRKYLEDNFSPEDPLIWCGDLNVAPENIDVHNPKRLLGHVDFNPAVWEAFANIKEWGLVDVFRKHHPGEPNQYTFFDYRIPGTVERGLGWRVDHILATPGLAKKCLDCRIDMKPRLMEKSSDHTVMIAEFKI